MNASPNSNEFREFLLDRLPPEQAEAIEERMFRDEACFSDLQDAEDELIEDYVTDSLDPSEARVFGARVDRDPELQERVAIRRALIRALQPSTSEVRAAAAATAPRARRGLWGRFLVPGFALAILIVLFLAFQAERRNRLPSQATATPPATPAKSHAAKQPEAMSAAAAVLFLPAHVARGANAQASVLHLGSAGVVRLELETPTATGLWNVRIANGETVFRSEGLSPKQAGVVSYVVAELPAAQLPPQIYHVTLAPQSESGAAASSWDLHVVK